MRVLLLLTASFGCALTGWIAFSLPASAGSDKAPIVNRAVHPSQPDFSRFSAVADEKHEEAVVAQCDAKATNKQFGHDDKIAFVLKCLQTTNSEQR
jgi:hypothetical protein